MAENKIEELYDREDNASLSGSLEARIAKHTMSDDELLRISRRIYASTMFVQKQVMTGMMLLAPGDILRMKKLLGEAKYNTIVEKV